MKVVFFGTSEFAIPALRALIQNGIAPAAVVTASDKPKGRGQRVTPPPIKQWLMTSDQWIEKTKNTQILQPEKLDSDLALRILNLKPDIGVTAAYGKILPKALIESFPKGVLNLHPSLLPKYRGPSPIQATILNGDTETGVTIIQIDEKMDHGPIVAQQRWEPSAPLNDNYDKFNKREVTSPSGTGISTFHPPLLTKERGQGGEVNNVSLKKITYSELHDTLAELGAQLLIEILPKWVVGKIIPTPQDDAKATYTKLLKKRDGKIDWSKPAEEIERMVRAYNPWPGSYTRVASEQLLVTSLKIKKAEVIMPPLSCPIVPGTFFKTPDGFPTVVCGKDALKLLIVQQEGKNEMPGNAYARGYIE